MLPLFTIEIPDTVLALFSTLQSTTTFEIINFTPFHKNLYGLKDISDYTAYNNNFAVMSYDNTNCIYILGTLFVPMELIGFVLIFLPILKSIKIIK
jgi:hypothetical protein